MYIKSYMGKTSRVLVLIFITFLLQNCRSLWLKTKKPDLPVVITAAHFTGFKDYLLDHVALDYIANCKVRIKTPVETLSGSCSIIVTHQRRLRLTVYSPLGGVLMAIYMDESLIQVLERSEKKFYQMKNTEANRSRILKVMNLTVAEFQEILWGRKIRTGKSQLEFEFNNQQPFRVKKRIKGGELIVVYQKWFKYMDVWFPKLLEIEDSFRHTSIKLAITKFTPGYANDIKIKNVPLDYQKIS